MLITTTNRRTANTIIDRELLLSEAHTTGGLWENELLTFFEYLG